MKVLGSLKNAGHVDDKRVVEKTVTLFAVHI